MTFCERFVEAGGVRIRYLEAGQGVPLVHLHGAGALRLTAAHELLARRFRVMAFEMPDVGPEVLRALEIDTFNLMGTSFGGTTALALAREVPARVLALVLEAPTAIPPEGAAGLATPTLVLFGTMDSVDALARGRVYKASMPNCHLVLVYAATHAISADRPDAFAEVVIDFLERREAFVISRAETVIHP